MTENPGRTTSHSCPSTRQAAPSVAVQGRDRLHSRALRRSPVCGMTSLAGKRQAVHQGTTGLADDSNPLYPVHQRGLYIAHGRASSLDPKSSRVSRCPGRTRSSSSRRQRRSSNSTMLRPIAQAIPNSSQRSPSGVSTTCESPFIRCPSTIDLRHQSTRVNRSPVLDHRTADEDLDTDCWSSGCDNRRAFSLRGPELKMRAEHRHPEERETPRERSLSLHLSTLGLPRIVSQLSHWTSSCSCGTSSTEQGTQSKRFPRQDRFVACKGKYYRTKERLEADTVGQTSEHFRAQYTQRSTCTYAMRESKKKTLQVWPAGRGVLSGVW